MLVPLLRLYINASQTRTRYIKEHLPEDLIKKYDERVDKAWELVLQEMEYLEANNMDYVLMGQEEADKYFQQLYESIRVEDYPEGERP